MTKRKHPKFEKDEKVYYKDERATVLEEPRFGIVRIRDNFGIVRKVNVSEISKLTPT